MRFSLHDCPPGVVTAHGNRVVYDVGGDEAWFGAARVDGHALLWELAGEREDAMLSVDVELDPRTDWVMRCDRVDFPPGGVAYRHVHPGPGIRWLLHGELAIERPDQGRRVFGPSQAWFEGVEDPVLATASASEQTAFVRVLLLPAQWRGRRTIRYLDPADEEQPKLQRATVFLENGLVP